MTAIILRSIFIPQIKMLLYCTSISAILRHRFESFCATSILHNDQT